MPESVLVDVANAVREKIADHDFGIEFVSEMTYADASRELKDLENIHIDVVPWRAPIVGLMTRGSFDYEVSVDIVIRKRFPQADHSGGEVDVASVNRLLRLVQDVEEFFTPSVASGGEVEPLAGYPNASWKQTDKKMDYSRPHLYSKSQFTGWIRLTYELGKEPG